MWLAQAQVQALASLFAKLFDLEPRESAYSYRVKDYVEIMKSRTIGQFGHIALSTCSLPRARHYFESLGFDFDEATQKTDAQEKVIAISFVLDFGGLALHLLQK